MGGKRSSKDGREEGLTAPTGTLYVVATPIGNLEDITLRALRTLKEVDLVAAEDTRHTRKLLTHYGIGSPLISYYRHKEVERGQEIVSRLLTGDNVALVSDAGTPAISDPGGILVDMARQHGIPVVPIPGPSAVTAFLSVAGSAFTPFIFYGFLPARQNQRRKILTSMASEPKALVFFESPQRFARSLQDCFEILGDRRAVIAREITKLHEEIRQDLLSAFLAGLTSQGKIKGELVVAVEGASPREQPPEFDDLRELLTWYRQETSYSLRDVVQQVTKDLGLSRTEVYQQALQIWKK